MEPPHKNSIFQRLSRDASRFVMVGCICYAIDFLVVFQLLVRWAGFHPLAAQPISRFCGGVVSFTLNRFWTFRQMEQSNRIHVQFARYWMVWIGTLIVSESLIFIFYNLLQLDKHSSKILADGLSGILSFFVQRHWTFR